MSNTHPMDELRLRLAAGILTADDCKGMSTDDVLSLKESTRYRSSFGVVDSKQTDAKNRSITIDGSTEHRDRMGDVVRVYGRKGGKGWQTDRYMAAGGPFLWAHDATAPPVGQTQRIWRGKAASDNGVNALKFRVGFEEDRDFPFANLVGKLFLSGRMKGTSVGFVIGKAERYSTQEEREKAGLGPNGIEVTEADLLELSGTPTPANPFALATAGKSINPLEGVERAIEEALDGLVQEGQLTPAQVRGFREQYALGPDDAQQRVKARVRGFVDFGGLELPDPASGVDALLRAAEDSAELVERVKPDGLKPGEFASWNSSGGRARGRVERIERDGTINVPDSDFTVSGTAEDPAALLRVYGDNGKPTDTLVAHKLSALTKIEPIEAEEEERMTHGADVEQRGRGRRKPEEGKPKIQEEDDPENPEEQPEDEQEEGMDKPKPKRPRKTMEGELVIPKQYVERFRSLWDAVSTLQTELEDVLDVMDGDEPIAQEDTPTAENGEEKAGMADLLTAMSGLVAELRASRVQPDHTVSGPAAAEKAANEQDPMADGQQRAVEADEAILRGEIESLLSGVRLATSGNTQEQ